MNCDSGATLAPLKYSVVLEGADRAMARYASGDDASFVDVFRSIAPRLLRFSRRLSGSDEAARDLLQETLLRMHQARSVFRPGTRVLPWAYAILRNAFLDSARRRPALSLSELDRELLDEPVVHSDAESRLFAFEAARAVDRALWAMTPARREAFVLLRYEGLSIEAAASLLGVSENAVKLRAFQAHEAIREALDRLDRPPLGGERAFDRRLR